MEMQEELLYTNLENAVGEYTSSSCSASYQGLPFLKIVVQPQKKIRFRYGTESNHGVIYGERCISDVHLLSSFSPEEIATKDKGERRRTKNKVEKTEKLFPTVMLENIEKPPGSVFIIKCSLYTDEENPRPHQVCFLEGENIEEGVCTKHLDNVNNRATFPGMRIFTKTKSEYLKTRTIYAETSEDGYNEKQLRKEAEKEYKTFCKHKVKLCFEAFYGIDEIPICEKVFSNSIYNENNCEDLNIDCLSHYSGLCSGGVDMVIVSAKVNKEILGVQFFTEDGWSADAIFEKKKVKKQFVIPVKIPLYPKNIDANAFIRLYSKKDNNVGKAIPFKYLQDSNLKYTSLSKKRKVTNSGNCSADSFSDETMESQDTTTDFSKISNSSACSSVVLNQGRGIDSDDDGNSLSVLGNPKGLYDDVRSLKMDAAMTLLDLNPELSAVKTSTKTKSAVVFPKETTIKPNLENVFEGMTSVLRHADPSMCQRLVATQDLNGNNFLHLAITYESRTDLINSLILVASEDALNHQNMVRESPLSLAVKKKNIQVVDALLRRDANPNAVNMDGQSCVHLACEMGSAECLGLLLEPLLDARNKRKIQPNINSPDNNGCYPVQVAVLKNAPECLKLLLQAKVDTSVCEVNGEQTALYLTSKENVSLAEMLKQKVDQKQQGERAQRKSSCRDETSGTENNQGSLCDLSKKMSVLEIENNMIDSKDPPKSSDQLDVKIINFLEKNGNWKRFAEFLQLKPATVMKVIGNSNPSKRLLARIRLQKDYPSETEDVKCYWNNLMEAAGIQIESELFEAG